MSRKDKWLIAITVALSLMVVAACFITPYLFRSDTATVEEVEAEGLDPILKRSASFGNALRAVENNYVEEVDEKELLDAAERGIQRLEREGADQEALVRRGIISMVNSLHDPFSKYMDAKEVEMLDTQLSGRFSGIGAVMASVRNEIVVEKVMPGTPAEEVGLRDGDIVNKVDGKDVAGMELSDVVMMIRGPEGTKVILEIRRANTSSLLKFEITRREIEIPVIRMELKANNVGYISMTDWTENIDGKLQDALLDLRMKGARGLIIDLRSNGGGYMDPAVEAADLFLDHGVIVSSKGRISGTTQLVEAEKGSQWDFPVVILINRGTASSSEIFSAALHDNSRAVLVGETTFGKGSIQKLFRQGDGSALKITVGRYFTPKGISIDDEGIPPDVLVSNPLTGEVDLQMQEAERVIAALMAGQPY